MPITFRCSNPSCQKPMAAEDHLVGRMVRCPHCAGVSTVPAASPPAPSPPTPPPHRAAAPAPIPTMSLEPEEPDEAFGPTAPPRPAAFPPAPPPPRPHAPTPIPTMSLEPEEDEAFGAGGLAAPPPSRGFSYGPPPAYAPPPAPPQAIPPAWAAAARPTRVALGGGDVVLAWILLSVGLFFLLFLVASTFFNWLSASSAHWTPAGAIAEVDLARLVRNSIPGIRYGNGKVLFCAGLLMAGLVGLAMPLPRFRRRCATLAAAFGLFVLLMMLAQLVTDFSRAGIGVWLGLVAGLFVAGIFLTLALLLPSDPEEPRPRSRYGFLILAEIMAGVMGIVYLCVRLI